MSLLNRRRIFVLAGMLICAVPQIAPAQNPDEDAKAAIREVIEKFNSAYKQENGPDIIGEVLSDKAFTYARTAGEGPARILSKAAYVDAFKKYLWKKTPKKHEHRVDGLTVIGGMAYEFGTIIDVTEDGFDTQSEVFNVFAREEGGWKLVFSSVPDFFKGRGGSAAADEEAVRELARKFVATFNLKDPTPFAEFEELLAGDVVAVQSDGTMLQGRSEVAKFYQEHVDRIRRTLKHSEITWKGMTAKVLGGGAVVFGKLIIAGTRKDEESLIHQEEWETLVFRKTATGWQLTEEHGTAAARPTAQTPASPEKREANPKATEASKQDQGRQEPWQGSERCAKQIDRLRKAMEDTNPKHDRSFYALTSSAELEKDYFGPGKFPRCPDSKRSASSQPASGSSEPDFFLANEGPEPILYRDVLAYERAGNHGDYRHVLRVEGIMVVTEAQFQKMRKDPHYEPHCHTIRLEPRGDLK